MKDSFNSGNDTENLDLGNERIWQELYPALQNLARTCVYSLRIPLWQGQEEDIAVDIVQETCRRVLERDQKAKRGEAEPIHSLQSMMNTIAWNHGRDLRRRESRVFRLAREAVTQITSEKLSTLCDVSIENVYQEQLFRLAAGEIKAFPTKQRQAILIDLAIRMHFGKQPTALQAAFLAEGIDLQAYRDKMDNQIKSRHDSLVHHAYKRLAGLQPLQQYITPID